MANTPIVDQFNNPSNDYVYPALSPCAGAGDNMFLEFLPNDSIGIIQGSNILESLSFASLKIPVTAFNSFNQVVQPGEVIFVPGLTKGLTTRSEGFVIPSLVSTDYTQNPFFMTVDLSINFYRNFQYSNINISAAADASNNLRIDTALTVQLTNALTKVIASYDPSMLTFSGTQDGYNFDVTNVHLTLIDTSSNGNSPFKNIGFTQDFYLDSSSSLPYAKYPNSAVQGVIMKLTYPPTNYAPRNADVNNINGINNSNQLEYPYYTYNNGVNIGPYKTIYDDWIYMNHLIDPVTIYSPIEVANFFSTITVTFDPSIKFGPFVGPIVTPILSGLTIDSSIIGDVTIQDCSIVDSSIFNCEIYRSDLRDVSTSITIQDSSIENVWINKFVIDPSLRIDIQHSLINDASIMNCTISDTSIFKSYIYDVSLLNCTLYNCQFDTVTFQNCRNITIDQDASISNNYLDPSTYYTKTIKSVAVGMGGPSTPTTMSSGDYLTWVQENNLWFKVGQFYAWTAAPDFSDTKNLINGFYVFNPHTFSVKLEYILFI